MLKHRIPMGNRRTSAVIQCEDMKILKLAVSTLLERSSIIQYVTGFVKMGLPHTPNLPHIHVS